MQIYLKRAQSEDADQLIEFVESYYRLDGLPFDRDKAARALMQLIQDEAHGCAWIVQYGKEPIGYVVLTLGFSLEYHGRDAFIDELYLSDGFRRRGFGRQVIALAEEEAIRMGVTALHLEVERKNKKAQGFYRRAGYIDHDRYLMTKRLQPQRIENEREDVSASFQQST